jgi:hypothetical protein
LPSINGHLSASAKLRSANTSSANTIICVAYYVCQLRKIVNVKT